MSPSSSGSWSGARGADIIDLDRYMRGNVRPSRTLSGDTDNERLVVDAGGACKPCSSASGDARHKRHSHDSGVEDGSYRRSHRTHRPHRRSQDGPNFRSYHEATPVSGQAAPSLRAFRAVCREALRDQQQQIARVAQLCERLAERAARDVRPDRNTSEKTKPHGRSSAKAERQPSDDTSDISSSSRSTKDWRRDKSQECKTYKIIMNKLDELNRMFAHRLRLAPRVPRVRTASSTSVSVCDKLTATDPPRPAPSQSPPPPRDALAAHEQLSRRPASLASTRVVACAVAVDIAPRPPEPVPNVHTESIVKCGSSAEGSRRNVAGGVGGGGAEDPLHLYTQAKRLRAFTASTWRSRSVEGECTHGGRRHWTSRAGNGPSAPRAGRAPSLCSVCRAYWRCIRRYVEPMFARAASETCDFS